MIRPETLNLSPIIGTAQIHDAYAIMWDAYAAENKTPLSSVVRARIEYANHVVRTVQLLPGSAYGGSERMARVWLYGPESSIAFVSTDGPDDRIQPTTPPVDVSKLWQQEAVWTGPRNFTWTSPPADQYVTIAVPPWATRGMLAFLGEGGGLYAGINTELYLLDEARGIFTANIGGPSGGAINAGNGWTVADLFNPAPASGWGTASNIPANAPRNLPVIPPSQVKLFMSPSSVPTLPNYHLNSGATLRLYSAWSK